MKNTLRKATLFAIAAGAACFALAAPSAAEDITLRLKGGGFEMTGKLEAYDGQVYRLTSPEFGTTSLDATRFDCVSSNCPTGPVGARISLTSLSGLGANAEVQIAGSNTVGNALMPALIEAFAKRNNLRADRVVGADPLELTFELKTATGAKVATIGLKRFGSSTSFRALRSGEAEIGMSSRPIKDAEVSTLQAAGLGNLRAVGSEHVIGLDGLLILVSPNNPIVSLSVEQVAKVFAGEIMDWSQLGRATPGPIDLFAPGDDSGTFETFNNLVLKPYDA